jgi:hypothetical protein
MPALNFQARFASAVESGEKRQTIRKRRKDGRDPKPGDTLYLYTGMRTKACRKLGEAVCTRVQEVAFGRMVMGGQRGTWFQGPGYLKSIAKRDGFETKEEMLDWFEKTHGLPFEGLLIRW